MLATTCLGPECHSTLMASVSQWLKLAKEQPGIALFLLAAAGISVAAVFGIAYVCFWPLTLPSLLVAVVSGHS